MSYCILNAVAANGKPSKLWADLKNKYKDMSITKGIYSAVMNKSFLENYGDKLIYDANGEPTLESLEGYVTGATMNTDAQAADFMVRYNAAGFNGIADAVRTAVEFNNQHEDMIMDVGFIDTKRPIISVKKAGLDSILRKKQIEAMQHENQEVERLMEKFGLKVNVLDVTPWNASFVMSPENLGETAHGLQGVVNLANNISGYQSLTDSFAHMLVEVMRVENNPIIVRAEKFLQDNPNLVEEILGEDYDDLRTQYNDRNTPLLLYTHALGKLVAGIVNKEIAGNDNQVTTRAAHALENFIKTVFKTNDKALIDEVNKLVEELKGSAQEIMDRDYLSTETMQRFKDMGRTILQTQNALFGARQKLKKASQAAEDNMLKFLKVYANDEKRTNEVEKMYAVLDDHMRNAKFLEGTLSFFNDIVENVKNDMEAVRNTMRSADPTFYDLKGCAHELLNLHNMVSCFREPVNMMKGALREMLEEATVNDDERSIIESILLNVAPQCISIINDAEHDLYDLNRKTIELFANRFFNDGNGELVIPYGKHKGEVIELSQILDVSMGDINILQRLLVSASNTDDMFIQLIDEIITDTDERERSAATAIDHKIQQLDKVLRESMGRNYSTSFMYERDSNGNLTGNIVSGYRLAEWQRDRQAEEDRLTELYTDRNGEINLEKVSLDMQKWDADNSSKEPYRVLDPRKFQDKDGKWKMVNDTPRTYRMPGEKYRDGNFQKDWSDAQKQYYKEYIKIKQEQLDMLLPVDRVHPFRAIQMMVASTGEAILNSDNGIMGGLKNAASAFVDNYFRITENDNGEYYDGSQGKVKGYIGALRRKYQLGRKNVSSTPLTFDKRVYKEVPTYFCKSLENMSKLSTDATSALREYNLMAVHYNCMHSIADMMELFKEHNRYRSIKTVNDMGQKVIEKVSKKIGGRTETAEMEAEFETEATNVYKRVEELIDARVYNRTREQGTRIIGNLTSGKIIDDLIKLTSFSLLGYSAFSGINNVLMAKQQMMIEAFGGRYFGMKEWAKADKEFMKYAFEVFAELHTPYTTSRLGLLGEMFNVGQGWKEHIKDSKAYKNSFEQFMSNFGPSCLLESGEYSIQMSTAISMMLGYKLYKGDIVKDADGNITNEYVTLWDAIEKRDVKNKSGKIVDAKLYIKDEYKDYVKKDGKKFVLRGGSNDVKKLSKLIGHVNQMMHGIYNKEDQAVITRYGVGRMLMLFRKHMVPQLQNRYRGLGKSRPIYNFRTGEFEEGYMVTAWRFIRDCLRSKDSIRRLQMDGIDDAESLAGRIALIKGALTKYEKTNLRKATMEITQLAVLFIIGSLLMADWDEEDDWTKRQVLYFTKRMQLEASMPYSLSSFMDVLISPSATISQLQRYNRFFGSIGQTNHIIQSGPYKGHSVTYANLMRCLPVYPQIYDFVNIDQDNRRFQPFSKSQTPILDILGMTEDEE